MNTICAGAWQGPVLRARSGVNYYYYYYYYWCPHLPIGIRNSLCGSVWSGRGVTGKTSQQARSLGTHVAAMANEAIGAATT
eukprot:4291005-Prymnesium_polylepis.1